MEGPLIADSARRHEVSDESMLHALRNAVSFEPHDEGFTLYVGPDEAGRLIEVGTIESDDGDVVVVHAMRARRRFMR